MIYAAFLCDNNFKIHKVIHCIPELALSENRLLTEYISNPEVLHFSEEKMISANLKFTEINKELTAFLCLFSDYILVMCAEVGSKAEFKEFAHLYSQVFSWAEKNVRVPYQDEYHQIQLLNNKLINSQRSLTRTNKKLSRALIEIQNANSTISQLERDEQTNLYRTSAFYVKVQKMFKKAPDVPLDIMVLSIAHFTLANDVYGWKYIENFLKTFSEYLIGIENAENGVFAHASAEIFYIAIPKHLRFYETLCRELDKFFAEYPLSIHLSACIGVYTAETKTITVEQMCSRAKLALETLDVQKNVTVAFYDQTLQKKLLSEHTILDSVHKALANNEFKLYLQPKVDIFTNEVIGAEALIRWIHPEFGLISPDSFIPILEKEGTIYQVDQYIWEEACKFLKTRNELGLKHLTVSVNLARGDCYQPDLLDVLLKLIKKYDLSPNELNLEIIERTYTNDSDNIYRILSSLRSAGFSIEMDDFGVGASSLSMAADMPVDVLKLDRSFLTNDLNDTRHVAIIQFIINLAKVLHMKIIAEGVETQEQAELLKSFDCHYAQGYLYSKPIPVDLFLETYI